MSSTKRKIYIAVIVICFALSGAVLYFGLKSPVAPAPGVVEHNTAVSNDANDNLSSIRSGGVGIPASYGAPSVFPRDTKFDWSLTESTAFKSLVPIPDLVLDPAQVGRANPFSH